MAAAGTGRRSSSRCRPIAIGQQAHILGFAADDVGDRQGQQGNEQADGKDRFPPAECGNAKMQQRHYDSPAAGKGGHQGGQGYRLAPHEPLIDRGHQGLPQAGGFAYGHHADEQKNQLPVFLRPGQQHQPQAGGKAAKEDERPGAELVHQPADQGRAQAALGPGQAEHQGHGGVGKAQIAADGFKETGKAGGDGPVAEHPLQAGGGDHFPAVKEPARRPRPGCFLRPAGGSRGGGFGSSRGIFHKSPA